MKSYKVSGMSCAACSARVEGAVKKLSGVEFCSVNLLTGVMQIEGDVEEKTVISAVEAAGYKAELQNGKNSKNVKHFLKRLYSLPMAMNTRLDTASRKG